MSVPCVNAVRAPPGGKTSRPFGSARPSQEPDREFSLILYLTETKSIVSILSGFMCVYHKGGRSEGTVALYAHSPFKGFTLKHVKVSD